MKVGDLVFHVEDIDSAAPSPGIVTQLTEFQRGTHEALRTKYARVQFAGRTFDELHPLCDLAFDYLARAVDESR
jgi:hypothetical protein